VKQKAAARASLFVALFSLLYLSTLMMRSASAAAIPSPTLSGYWKNFALALDLKQTDEWSGLAISRLRLNLNWSPADWLSFSLSEDVYATIQDAGLASILRPGGLNPQAASGYRLTAWNTRLIPAGGEAAGNFELSHNPDRFFALIKLPFADVTVGRQPVSWGSSRVVNPTDVIVPFSFSELDKEERFGVDALRVRVPLGSLGELEGGFVAGKGLRPENSALFLRGKVNVFKTDLSLIALEFRRHLLLGLDISRSIGQAGGWLECAYVINNPDKSAAVQDDSNYFRLSAGLDGQLFSGVYTFAEYHYSSAGASRPEDYPLLPAKNAFRDGAVYLLGRHYGTIGATFQLSPLLSGVAMVLHNFSDGSWCFGPQIEYNVREDVYLAAGAFLFTGKSSSEFGLYPNLFFTSFRFYF
jgi:hypothetical protein